MLLFSVQLLFCQDTRKSTLRRKNIFPNNLRTYIPTARHWHASAKTPIKRVLHLARACPYPTLPSTGQCLLHATYHSHHNQPIHPPHTCNPEFTKPASSFQRPSFFSLPSQPKHTHFTTQNTPPAHMPPMPYQSHPPPNVTSTDYTRVCEGSVWGRGVCVGGFAEV